MIEKKGVMIMKTRIPALLLCLAMLTALVPTGILSIPAAAAPDNNFCKTENVEVPAGWDYVEVSNAEELLATEEGTAAGIRTASLCSCG